MDDEMEDTLAGDAPNYASTLFETEEDIVVQRYLTDDLYDSLELIALLKRFKGEYIPTIHIHKELNKYRVGVDEKVATEKGSLIRIERKWRGVYDQRRGQRKFPHLYYASPEQLQQAPTQLWNGQNLKWLRIEKLEIIVDESIEGVEVPKEPPKKEAKVKKPGIGKRIEEQEQRIIALEQAVTDLQKQFSVSIPNHNHSEKGAE